METTRILLEWHGPFTDTSPLPSSTGVYAMAGRIYGREHVSLLYVGLAQTVTIAERWTDSNHRNWLSRTAKLLDGGLYYAELAAEYVDDVETALIYVHQPNQNASKLSGLPSKPYIIHNTNNIPPGMLPVIDTSYPWFGVVSKE